jgi:hypothetical protein
MVPVARFASPHRPKIGMLMHILTATHLLTYLPPQEADGPNGAVFAATAFKSFRVTMNTRLKVIPCGVSRLFFRDLRSRAALVPHTGRVQQSSLNRSGSNKP